MSYFNVQQQFCQNLKNWPWQFPKPAKLLKIDTFLDFVVRMAYCHYSLTRSSAHGILLLCQCALHWLNDIMPCAGKWVNDNMPCARRFIALEVVGQKGRPQGPEMWRGCGNPTSNHLPRCLNPSVKLHTYDK